MNNEFLASQDAYRFVLVVLNHPPQVAVEGQSYLGFVRIKVRNPP